mgnify:FL=1
MEKCFFEKSNPLWSVSYFTSAFLNVGKYKSYSLARSSLHRVTQIMEGLTPTRVGILTSFVWYFLDSRWIEKGAVSRMYKSFRCLSQGVRSHDGSWSSSRSDTPDRVFYQSSHGKLGSSLHIHILLSHHHSPRYIHENLWFVHDRSDILSPHDPRYFMFPQVLPS